MTDVVGEIGAVVAFLIADENVSEVVPDSKIFGSKLPVGEVPTMAERCVIVKGAGGPADGTLQDGGWRRIDTFCYGPTVTEAEIVHVAVRRALRQMQRFASGDTLLHNARLSSNGAAGTDPDTGWPLVLASYLVRYGVA